MFAKSWPFGWVRLKFTTCESSGRKNTITQSVKYKDVSSKLTNKNLRL